MIRRCLRVHDGLSHEFQVVLACQVVEVGRRLRSVGAEVGNRQSAADGSRRLDGVGIGFAETAEATAVASMTEDSVRGSAFGLLAGLQSLGNLTASAVAGLLWTALSPTVAFLWLGTWMAIACIAFLTAPSRRTSSTP